jgi:hypothetical protein
MNGVGEVQFLINIYVHLLAIFASWPLGQQTAWRALQDSPMIHKTTDVLLINFTTSCQWPPYSELNSSPLCTVCPKVVVDL